MTDGKPIRTLKITTSDKNFYEIWRKAKRQLEKEYGEPLTDQQALKGICVDYLLRRTEELINKK